MPLAQGPRFGAPSNLGGHYQYPAHSQPQQSLHMGPGLPLPGFMNPNSMNNPFSTNGNALGMGNGFGGAGLGMPGGTGLASQAAQMSFAGAVSHQVHNGVSSEAGSGRAGKPSRIRDVWKGNLHEEFNLLRQLIDKYPYVSMDTEFPGLVARPMGHFSTRSDYHYQTLRCNIDLLKMIQLGITLFTATGDEIPAITVSDAKLEGAAVRRNPHAILPCTWQFNFDFSLKDDMYAELSIDSLKKAGVDFETMESEGINHEEFGALLISSGLVADEGVRWLSFHGAYDFGYLTSVCLNTPLPENEQKFEFLMKKYFPCIYDVKYLMKYASKSRTELGPLSIAAEQALSRFDAKGSLESIGEIFAIKRLGDAHSGGSDALLTGRVFFKLKDVIFKGDISDDHLGWVWGLDLPEGYGYHGHGTPQRSTTQQAHTTPNQNGNTYTGAPSTPLTGNASLAALASTPAHVTNNGSGPQTPGGGGISFGGGAFGGFMTNNNR